MASLHCSRTIRGSANIRRQTVPKSVVVCNVAREDKEDVKSAVREMNEDPVLSKVFHKPKVQNAIKDIQKDVMNVSKYKNDPEIMQVMNRLLNFDLTDEEKDMYREIKMTPSQLLSDVGSNKELTRLLLLPVVKQAIEAIKVNPEAAIKRYKNVPEVARVLELMEKYE